MSRLALLPLLLMLVATACEAKGMGWIPSAVDPTEKATFGFVYDGTTQTFSGSYHDHGNGVRFKGTGVLKAGPPPAGMRVKGDACLIGVPTYESQDPARPGTGSLDLTVCDGGDEDYIIITVLGGPFILYHNEGIPSGNVTVTHP